MNHAIEHLQRGLAVNERELTDARASLKQLQQQAVDTEATIKCKEEKRTGLLDAIAALRAPAPPVEPAVIEQQKITLNGKRKAN
jgi:hypothetical protein